MILHFGIGDRPFAIKHDKEANERRPANGNSTLVLTFAAGRMDNVWNLSMTGAEMIVVNASGSVVRQSIPTAEVLVLKLPFGGPQPVNVQVRQL